MKLTGLLIPLARTLAAIDAFMWLNVAVFADRWLFALVPLPVVAAIVCRRYPLAGATLVLLPSLVLAVLLLPLWLRPGPYDDPSQFLPLDLALVVPSVGAAVLILLVKTFRLSRDIPAH